MLVVILMLIVLVVLSFYFCRAGDFVIVRFAPESIQMQTHVAHASIATGRDKFVIGNRIAFDTPFAKSIKALRHTIINNIHHAANRTAAVKQGCGAAQNFYLARGRRFGRHCMVRANA